MSTPVFAPMPSPNRRLAKTYWQSRELKASLRRPKMNSFLRIHTEGLSSKWVWVQIKPPNIGLQVLVLVSIYQVPRVRITEDRAEQKSRLGSKTGTETRNVDPI